jgi:hypothetical protein
MVEKLVVVLVGIAVGIGIIMYRRKKSKLEAPITEKDIGKDFIVIENALGHNFEMGSLVRLLKLNNYFTEENRSIICEGIDKDSKNKGIKYHLKVSDIKRKKIKTKI